MSPTRLLRSAHIRLDFQTAMCRSTLGQPAQRRVEPIGSTILNTAFVVPSKSKIPCTRNRRSIQILLHYTPESIVAARLRPASTTQSLRLARPTSHPTSAVATNGHALPRHSTAIPPSQLWLRHQRGSRTGRVVPSNGGNTATPLPRPLLRCRRRRRLG